jgi:AcrR family transcriptional regulator
MSVLAKRTYKAADERREQILDCALQVFADRGYHGASIADVCTRAGIGRATLYQYFDDKRDVLLALADRITRRVTEAVAARPPLSIPEGFVPTEEVALAVVTAHTVSILRVVFADAATCRLLLRAGRGADGVVDELLRSIDTAVVTVIEADLLAAQRAGVLRPLDVHFTARFFLGGIEKTVLDCLDTDRPVDVEGIARQAAEIELFGTLACLPYPPDRRRLPVTPAAPAGPASGTPKNPRSTPKRGKRR